MERLLPLQSIGDGEEVRPLGVWPDIGNTRLLEQAGRASGQQKPMKKSDRDGLERSVTREESNGSTTTQALTDGGFSRRKFLGAAAALAGLTGAANGAAATQLEPDISRGMDCVRADCGSVTTPGPVAEMFAIPEEGGVRIEGYRAEDTDEHSVQMDIYTGSSEPRLSLKQILSPEDARDNARRLNAAADVAAGETEEQQ